MTAPPMGPPPMGGPRPGMVRPPPATMGGSGGSSDSPQEVLASLANLFSLYTQFEQNLKARQETESKYSILCARLSEGALPPHIVGQLKLMTAAAEQGNFAGALAGHKDLIQKSWAEAKDWANALKVLLTFK